MDALKLQNLAQSFDFKQSTILPEQKKLSLTERITGVNWQEHFPVLKENFEIRLSTMAECFGFMQSHSELKQQREQDGEGFVDELNHPNRQRYYEETVDYFAFYSRQGEMLGFFVCNLQDWSTYYIRYTWMNPKARGQGCVIGVINALEKTLSPHGISRITADVSPSNFNSLAIMQRCQFNATGYSSHASHGVVVNYSKYINANVLHSFLNKFCRGEKIQVRSNPMEAL